VGQKGKAMEFAGAQLAPETLVRLILHYAHREDLHGKEIRKVLFVDDTKYPEGIYSERERTLVLNFGTMDKAIPAYDLYMLDRIPAIWAVQVCVALSKMRIAIQVKNGLDKQMTKRARVEDSYSWTYVEFMRLVFLDRNLYMPGELSKMGIMGQRLREKLAAEYKRGGARIDLAGLQVKGAVEFNKLWRHLTHDAMLHLRKLRAKKEIGIAYGHHMFLSFYEWFVYCYEKYNIQKAAQKGANESIAEYAQDLLRFDSERAATSEPKVVGESTVVGG
jgi:hypothetical protein